MSVPTPPAVRDGLPLAARVRALQLPGLQQPACWQVRHRSDPAARCLADRHYSQGRRGAPWIRPPGWVLVQVTGDETAVWVTHWPLPALAQDGLDAWRCSLFRNEGPGLSSALFKLAMTATLHWWAAAWPGSPWRADLSRDGWITWVAPRQVASTNPGYCFKQAGWTHDRTWRRHTRLVRLRAPLTPQDDPE